MYLEWFVSGRPYSMISRYSHTVLDDAVDFVKIAEGMGAKAIRVTKMEEVEPAIRRGAGLQNRYPVVLDLLDRSGSQRVSPMSVRSGASLKDVFDVVRK